MTDDFANLAFKGTVTIGFFAFAAAVYLAHSAPATGYELSIYRATPLLFWIGIGIGLVASAIALFGTTSRRVADAAMALAALSLLAVVAIPVIRSYAFYGSGDALTHLGWAREIQSGVIDPDRVLYPSDHLLGVTLAELTGFELTRTLPIVSTLLFPLLYLIAMPLCVASITDSRWAAPVGLFTALLLLPINKISVHVVPHPSSQAILFVPFVVLLLFGYLAEDAQGFPLTTPAGAAFGLGTLGLLFVHPQETMTLLSMLVAITVVQFVARRYVHSHPIARHRSVGVHTVVLGVALFVWLVRHERAVNRFNRVIDGLVTVGVTVGTETAERGDSLTALGGSFEELFVKLFAVSLVISLIAAAVMASNLAGKLDPAKTWRNSAITYLTFGLVPPAGLAFVIYIANQGNHYFRFLGFIMAIVAIVGAVGVAMLFDRYETAATRPVAAGMWERSAGTGSGIRTGRSKVVGVAVVVVLVMLVAQVAVIHQAPYIYQSNQQVTAGDLSGHEVAFEYHDGETPLLGLRSGEFRFVDAHFGRTTAQEELDFPGYGEGVPGEVFSTNLTTHYEGDRYLAVGDRDEQREIGLYDELRYTRDGFDRLESDSRVNRIQDNGDFRLYRL